MNTCLFKRQATKFNLTNQMMQPGTELGGGRWGFTPRRTILKGVIFLIINN
jgi:hypothetical protein